MRPFPIRIALAVALSGAAMAALGAPAMAQAVPGGQSAPIPAPEIYDPSPGPFYIVLNVQGDLEDQAGVVSNALGSWSGKGLEAFTICFRSNSAPVDWGVALRALDAVSRELLARGAKVVVTPATNLCAAPLIAAPAGKSYVEIMGVIRW